MIIHLFMYAFYFMMYETHSENLMHVLGETLIKTENLPTFVKNKY